MKEKFVQDFIVEDRWHYLADGLMITIQVTLLSLFFGMLIGMLIAMVRSTHDQTPKSQMRGLSGLLLRIANALCKLYVTVIRGTPTMVQMLIMYFIILISVRSKTVVAVVTFSINSGAYIAEIIRGGIMSVDKGQMEAGRSLGLNFPTTMVEIILPQALKAVLPALINETITLLKETSICGYIGLNELTRGADIIRGITYDAMFPLFGIALVYLVMVLFIQWALGKVERRLRASDLR